LYYNNSVLFPPMTQPQREALLDLLIIGILVDSQLSPREDAALEAAFRSIGWEGSKPRDMFICSSLNRARFARGSDAATTLYINSRARMFPDEGSRTRVLNLLEQVFEADGLVSAEEEFLGRVQAGFLEDSTQNESIPQPEEAARVTAGRFT